MFFFFLELCPFEKIWIKSCEQDILKSIYAGFLKFDMESGGIEEEITWLNFEPIKWNVVVVMALCNFWPFNVVALLCIA